MRSRRDCPGRRISEKGSGLNTGKPFPTDGNCCRLQPKHQRASYGRGELRGQKPRKLVRSEVPRYATGDMLENTFMPAIAVIGDYQSDNPTHTAIADSLQHVDTSYTCTWIATTDVTPSRLTNFQGIWCAPGSPYRSLSGALEGIRFARERKLPFLGTCAGFQHAVVEIGRNLLHIPDATSAEYDPNGPSLFISRLNCSLVGKEMAVQLIAGGAARRAYGSDRAFEAYYCNFGLNPRYEQQLETVGCRISGRDDSGEARILELAGHPFFVGTLFVPQARSAPRAPHPIIAAFARAVAALS